MRADELLFFSSAAWALPMYEALEEAVLAACPAAQVLVQKSQIAFACPRRFAFVSLRGRKFIVTFGLGERVDDSRIMQAVEPYPGRWTHHVQVTSPRQVDDQLLAWICQAYDLALKKG